MANIARGLRLPGLRPFFHPRPILPEISSTSSRSFTTSIRFQAARSGSAKPKSISKSPPKSSPTASKPAAAPVVPQQSSYAIAKSLASKPNPTVLYEGTSEFWYRFGCWSSGLSILGWTALTGPQFVFPPEVQEGAEALPIWVSYVYGSSYVILAAMGFYMISKTPNIVKQIRAIPTAVPRAAPAGAATAATAAPTVQMEVTVHRALPFLEPKVLVAPLSQVSLKSRLSLPEQYVPELRRQQIALEKAAQAKEQHKFDMQHLLTLPFRKLGRGCVMLFRGVKNAWTDMGFGVIRVDGKEYKVNVEKGFALDGFKTLERLVEIKPRK